MNGGTHQGLSVMFKVWFCFQNVFWFPLMGFCILPADQMYVLLDPFDPKMKLLVKNLLILLFASEKIKILFRKHAELVSWVFGGFGLVGFFYLFVFWHYTLCCILLLF